MDGVLSIICLAIAALFVVAIGVAWWEQVRGGAATRRPLPSAPTVVAKVDVELELPASQPADSADEQAARQALVGSAMSRMTDAAAAPASMAWGDTLPIGQAARAGRRPAAEAEPSTRH